MRYFNIFFAIVFSILLSSCKEEKIQDYSDNMTKSEEGLLSPNTPDFKPILQKVSTEKTIERMVKNSKIKDRDVKKMLSEIAYDAELVKVFTHLSEISKGEMKYAEDAKSTMNAILNILENHAKANTDIVFILDKTSSMADDIEEAQNNVQSIIDRCSKFKNIRMCLVTYGDKNVDGKDWYYNSGLTANLSQIKSIIKEVDLVDGGDYPESVNDAIYRTIEETMWSDNSQKMVMVIGDAPSHKKPYSSVEIEDIVRLCKTKNVVINFYPIIIAIDVSLKDGNAKKNEIEFEVTHFITKIAMNYSKESCRIELKYGSIFKVELYSIKGEKLAESKFFGSKFDLDVSNYPNGNYVVRVLDEQNNQLDGQFFDIER